MVTFLEYENLIQIHDGENSRVFRAHRTKDQLPVILKILKAEFPTLDQIRCYRQEYSLTRQLRLSNVIQAYELKEWRRTLVIIFEDFGGDAIREWSHQYPQGLPIDLFLLLAIKITDALGQLHSQAVIHKDINPANIALNPKTMAIKLIDLSISTQLSRENPVLLSPSALEGTLLYLSPEQTGRMNRSLDYRTDFYSLGITFYELLTGRLPFLSTDPMELVHCHIARQPISLLEVKHGQIPSLLALIVSKLMAKNAEDRYQSAWGLKEDLVACLAQWQKTGNIFFFPLGKNDVSDQLQIPQKLYGREWEVNSLLKAFDRVASTGGIDGNENVGHCSELVLVTGYSGIGKSALVRSLYKPITAKRGYFISGKFDQFQRNIPYSAVVDAFTSLVKQLLGEPEEILQQWRESILNALGTNGQVVIDVIPAMELILGTQPTIPELGVSENQNRFNLVFQKLIQVFCRPAQPLVIFLDDMQWVDLETLNLLERLMASNQVNHLLLLIAYRDNEVVAGHPLALAIAKLQTKGVRMEQIHLAPLTLEQIEQLMAETLHQEVSAIKDLADLALSKTEGNPFFINQFLKILYNENFLNFNYSLKQWQWHLEQIEKKGFTDNVVDLMVEQLQKLSPSMQEILSIAAYLGTEFDLSTLSFVMHQTSAAIFADLKLAMERGLIVARSPLDQNLLIQDYQFGHDRIQQAAYALVPREQQASRHLWLGRMLIDKTSNGDLPEHLFDLVDHINYGLALVTDPDEHVRFAWLNLKAGQKAMRASAYKTAKTYLESGISLLPLNAWESQYKLTLSLHEEAVKTAFLNAEFETMEYFAEIVMNRANNVIDRIKVSATRIEAYGTQNRLAESIATGLEILGQLGVVFPETPEPEDFRQALEKLGELIASTRPQE